MARDHLAYVAELEARGYTRRTAGSGHIAIYWQGKRVAIASGSKHGGRGLDNFKARIKRFERSLASGGLS